MSSNNDLAISLRNIEKTFRIYAQPVDRLKESIGNIFRRFYQSPPKLYHRKFKALSGISFDLNKGEILGVIGKNGAGKSTLLKLICGVLTPSNGTLTSHGRIAALLELGAGFNPEFSGRENIYLNAKLLGLSSSEINEKIDAIIAFSEIGDFIDAPVKTYSSGMYVRLAFSIATSIDPDILIIDEALSVGDGSFATKSFNRIMELKKNKTTILFCSHATYQIEMLCDRAIWLNEGRLMESGEPAAVVIKYNEFLDSLNSAPSDDSTTIAPSPEQHQNSHSSRLLHSSVYSSNGSHPITVNSQEDNLIIRLTVKQGTQAEIPTLAVMILDQNSRPIASNSTLIDGATVNSKQKDVFTVECAYEKLPLLKGNYSIDVFVLCGSGINVYEHIRNIGTFSVRQDHTEMGVVRLNHKWSETDL